MAGGQNYQVRYASKKSGKSRARVKNAVNKVGSSRKRTTATPRTSATVIFRGRADMAASTAGIPNTCNPRGIAWAGFGHHCSVKPPG